VRISQNIAFFAPNGFLEQAGLSFLARDMVSTLLTFDDSRRRVFARTTGSHFLNGQRTWGVNIGSASGKSEITVFTYARERYATPSFRMSNAAMAIVGQSFEDVLEGLWSKYLNNIADEFISAQKVIRKYDEKFTYIYFTEGN